MELKLRELARTNPAAADAVAIELVNSLTVAGDILRFRATRSWLGRLIDRFSSGDLALDESFGSGLAALSTLFADIEKDVVLTEMGVTTLARKVTGLQADAKRQSAKTSQVAAALQQVAAVAEKLQTRMGEIERRLAHVEIRVEGRDVIDRALAAWKAGRAYAGLPWLLQVTFLSREICSSRAVAAVFASGNGADVEQYVIDSIDAHLQSLAPESFSLATAIDETLAPFDTEDLVLFLTVTGQAAAADAPTMAALSLSTRLRLIADQAQPAQPAWCAIELLRGEGAELRFVMKRNEFIRAVLREWQGVAAQVFAPSSNQELTAASGQRLLTGA
ncbi:MAG: hypothetical protein QOF63_288 [Thermoanaerobaculia bacterium]|jgi:hypothetical protein|nr:hypothetical protein [Thermoanaerobaculia bacterium]MEA2413372.1 hypothetical protein [Thermoanaerobaculia bacterium]